MERRENALADLILIMILLGAFYGFSLPTVLLTIAKVSQSISGVFGRVGIECEKAAYKLNEKRALS